MQDAGTQKKRSRRAKLVALLAAIGVTSTLVAVGLQAGAFADEYGLMISGSVDPSQISQGSDGLFDLLVENYGEGPVINVVVRVFIEGDEYKLSAIKSLNGNICKVKNFGEGGDGLECKLGDIGGGDSKPLKVVFSTDGLSVGEEKIAFAEAFEEGGEVPALAESEGDYASIYDDFEVIAANNNETNTYVPPGGSALVGPAKPTADDPGVAKFTLPKRVLTDQPSGPPKLKPGPGASIVLKQSDPSVEPTGCGGDPCDVKIIELLSDFPGYEDPKRPVFLTVSFYGPAFAPGTLLYVIKSGVGVPVPKCIRVQGVYTNTPCLSREKVFKKAGVVTRIEDKIALLSGDPSVGRR